MIDYRVDGSKKKGQNLDYVIYEWSLIAKPFMTNAMQINFACKFSTCIKGGSGCSCPLKFSGSSKTPERL